VASRFETVQYIVDQAGLGHRLSYRRMFGEYALYVDDKVVALVCDDQLFLKPTPEGRTQLGVVQEGLPYPGARRHFLISAELDDPDELKAILDITARALPEPKATVPRKTGTRRKPRRPRAGGGGRAGRRPYSD
jgi:TfoX/Sxy family transcriptional regulator of competence genes